LQRPQSAHGGGGGGKNWNTPADLMMGHNGGSGNTAGAVLGIGGVGVNVGNGGNGGSGGNGGNGKTNTFNFNITGQRAIQKRVGPVPPPAVAPTQASLAPGPRVHHHQHHDVRVGTVQETSSQVQRHNAVSGGGGAGGGSDNNTHSSDGNAMHTTTTTTTTTTNNASSTIALATTTTTTARQGTPSELAQGCVFTTSPNYPGVPIVYRTAIQRSENSERLNLGTTATCGGKYGNDMP